MTAVYRGAQSTVIGGAGATVIDAAVPVGVTAGELLVAVIAWRGIGVVAATDGSWAERHDLPDTVGPQLAVYTRTAGGSEPATYNFTFSGAASRVIATLVRVSGHAGVETSTETSGNTTSVTAPSATSGGPGRLALYLWARSHLEIMSESGGDEAICWDDSSFGAAAGAVNSRGAVEVVGAGATTAKVATISVPRQWVGITLLIAPAAAPDPPMRLDDVMDQLGTRLATIAGLRSFAYPPDSITPPAAIVSYPEELRFDATYARGADTMTLPVIVAVGKVHDRTTRELVAGYCAGDGAASIKAVIESGVYTAFDVVHVSRAEFDVIRIGGTDYLAALFDLEIVGQGS